jgi:hypothetical protein
MTTADIDLFAPAQLTRLEVYRYNRIAHGAGQHMCTKCFKVYDYTDANFFKSSKRRADGTVILMGDCKTCRSEYTKDNERQRYQNDAAYQAKCKDRVKAYWRSLSPKAKQAHSKKRSKRERERAMQRGEN